MSCVINFVRTFWRTIVLVIAPMVLTPILFWEKDEFGEPTDPMRCLYVLSVMAVYWMTQALPLPITALIPLVAFPLLGVMSTNAVAINYLKATNFMFVGGLILAICVEQSGLHKRVALAILCIPCIGTKTRGIMLGFMITTASLSMWVSNTATVAMMIPIVNAVCKATSATDEGVDQSSRTMLLLAVAYAANIGGTGVITGSPPNLVVLELLKGSPVSFGSWMAFAIPLMLVNLMVAYAWLMSVHFISHKVKSWRSEKQELDVSTNEIAYVADEKDDRDTEKPKHPKEQLAMNETSSFNGSVETESTSCNEGGASNDAANDNPMPDDKDKKVERDEEDKEEEEEEEEEEKEKDEDEQDLQEELDHSQRVRKILWDQFVALGPMSTHEICIMICFIVLVALWFFLQPEFMEGWGAYFVRETERGDKSTVHAATPAIMMVLVVCALPRNYFFWPFQSKDEKQKSSESLICWDDIEKNLPWGVILLLGGGFALSDACSKSGLSAWLANWLLGLKHYPLWSINLIVSIMAATVTEFVSNTATANILLPILKQMSLSLCKNPVYLVMTSVLSCSYAFMLPVATAPNALVFTAGNMKSSFMMGMGFVMNLICVSTTNVAINLYGELALFSTFDSVPEWIIEEGSGGNCTTL